MTWSVGHWQPSQVAEQVARMPQLLLCKVQQFFLTLHSHLHTASLLHLGFGCFYSKLSLSDRVLFLPLRILQSALQRVNSGLMQLQRSHLDQCVCTANRFTNLGDNLFNNISRRCPQSDQTARRKNLTLSKNLFGSNCCRLGIGPFVVACFVLQPRREKTKAQNANTLHKVRFVVVGICRPCMVNLGLIGPIESRVDLAVQFNRQKSSYENRHQIHRSNLHLQVK